MTDTTTVPDPGIHWPDEFSPARADLFAHSEVEIAAPPATAWRHLVAATRWPEWYPHADHVRILTDPDDRLEAHSTFEFNTFGVHVDAAVGEFEPEERLGWLGSGNGLDSYHAWLISPTGAGCRVVSETVVMGPSARAIQEPDPHAMQRGHDLWVRRLKERAESRE